MLLVYRKLFGVYSVLLDLYSVLLVCSVLFVYHNLLACILQACNDMLY